MVGSRDNIFLIDANARVGSSSSAAVGQDGFSEDENEVGHMFHKFMLASDLVAPATFQKSGVSQHTWISPVGAKHRIDFVLVPLHWLPSVEDCTVLDDIDLLNKGADHRPVTITVSVSTQPIPQSRQWPAFRPDHKSLKDPDARYIFIKELQAAPPVPWDVPIDMHYALLIDNYDSAARKAFEPKLKHNYKAYFSKGTITLVQARKMISALLDYVPVAIVPEDMAFYSELVSIVLHNVINTLALSDQVTAFVYNVAFSLFMINMDVTIASPNAILDIVKFTRLSFLKFISNAASYDKKVFLQSKTDCSTDATVSSREQWQAINVVLKFGGRKPTQFAQGLRVQKRLKEDGTAATTPAEIADVVFKHFAKVESAAIVDPDDLVLLHNKRPRHDDVAQLSIRCTPSLH